MKIIFSKAAHILIIAAVLTSCATAQIATKGSPSPKDVDKWFAANEWSGGLKLKVFADVNKLELYTQYHKNKTRWDKAFAYLRDHDLASLPVGKVLIDGDSLYISVTDAPNKVLERTNWESHKKYIDLQYIVTGKERIMVANTSTLTVSVPYSDARDVMNYTGDGKSYTAEPGTYYLFFPTDAHRPSIVVEGFPSVKKAVIKIAYTP